jgi:hypothetical protein
VGVLYFEMDTDKINMRFLQAHNKRQTKPKAQQMLVDLVERRSQRVAKAIAATETSNRTAAHAQALEQVSEEAQEQRRILRKAYAGERLRRTFDWPSAAGAMTMFRHISVD